MQLLVSGCASAPLPRIYVLGAPRDATADPISAPDADRLLIARIDIPGYLDSTDIVMRHGPYELVTSSTGRWGERLSTGLRDALASDLGARLPHDFITTTHDLDPAARRLLLTVSALDVWPDGRCILAASWSITGQIGTAPILTRDTLRIPPGTGAGPGGDANVVASLAAAVALLADRIAPVIAALERSPAVSTGPGAVQ